MGSSFVFDFESALRLALQKSADFLEKRRSLLPVPPAYPLPIRVLDFGILSRPALVSDEDEEP